MNARDRRPDPSEWQPATSEPGEMFTAEGRIKAVGAFARGLKNDDPRLGRYRRPMLRTGMWLVLAVVAAIVVGVAATALS